MHTNNRKEKIEFCIEIVRHLIMKILKLMQKYYEVLGIIPPNKSGKFQSFNFKTLLAIFFYVQHCIASSAFLLIEAKTIREFAESFFWCETMVTSFFNAFIIILKGGEMFYMIRNFENTIEKREY